MPAADTLGPHLPYIRRFARALSGSQSAGDAYAVAALEAILQDPALLPATMDPRTALFRVLMKVWTTVPQDPTTDPVVLSGAMGAADRNLDAMSPLPRAAFLLRSVEGLSIEQVGEALDMTVPEASELIEAAGREIASQISTDVLIIEDEPLISMDLENLVSDLGHRAMHVSRTRADAVAAVRRRRPGLILADIRLADGSSGLDAVNEILAFADLPVVFITAFPEELLTGDRPEPTFLITKPFRTEMVQAVISQALFFDDRAGRKGKEAAVATA